MDVKKISIHNGKWWGRTVKREHILTAMVTVILLSAMVPQTSAYIHSSPCTPCCASIWNGFWVPCEGAQYVGRTNGWVWVRYNDNAVYEFEGKHSLEFEWILPEQLRGFVIHITSYTTNFISPGVDNAEGWGDPGTNEYGMVEGKPEDWVKGTQYQASFSLDNQLIYGISLRLEIELNVWKRIWGPFGYNDPEAGCQLSNVPVYGSAYWIHAKRTLTGYPHSTMDYRSRHEIKDSRDYITVDLISIEQMKSLNVPILGFEMFNPETRETVGVFLWDGESIGEGLESLKELGVKDLSGFRVFAIKLGELANPHTFANEDLVLTWGRFHPNDDEWVNLPKRG